MRIISHSEQETEALGERIGRAVRPGTVINLFGGLGAGKTALTRGIAAGLGCRDRVVSPTFTLVNEYHSGKTKAIGFLIGQAMKELKGKSTPAAVHERMEAILNAMS